MLTEIFSGRQGDITLAGGEDDTELPLEDDRDSDVASASGREENDQMAEQGLPPAVLAFMKMMKPMMEGNTAALAALAKAQTSAGSSGSKRKREEEEEEEEQARSRPILIHKVNHELKDDAHSTIDWEARKLRP